MPNKFDNSKDSLDEKLPDRPLECSDCKKPLAILYTEIVGATKTYTCMCSDCPVLQRKLHGERPSDSNENVPIEGRTELACGHCDTTLESVRMGSNLGCSLCYEVFEDVLVTELASMGKIPPRLVPSKKSQILHQGRVGSEAVEISSAMRLLSLNEALSETLLREDYEQAAWLRDQIKALTEAHQRESEKKEKSDER